MFAQFLGHKKSLGSASYVACSEDAYWSSVALLMHFDGVSTNSFIDETGKTVTVNGGTLITADNKKFGQGSGYFDGTGDYLSIRDGRLNLGTGDFTIESWVYFNNKTGYQSLLSKGYIATGDLLVQTAQNTSSFKFYASGTLIATESSEASLNTWHHYAFVRKSGVLYIYRDGSVTGSGACTQDLTNAFALKIGVGTHLVDGSFYFTGYIDEVRITKGIARYDSNSTKLLAHFDSPPATLDAMGNTADTGRTQPNIISGGVFNSCAEFSTNIGANPSLTVPTIGSTYTIEFFIKNRPGTAASGYILCLCSDLNNSSGYNFSIDTNSVLFYNGSYLTFSVSISSCLTPDTWNHVAIVCNASSLKLYVNGSLKDTINSGFNLTAHSLQIGYQKWGSTWYLSDILLDEIRISNNVRYSGNFTTPTSEFIPDGNTVVLMHFNEIASGGLVDVTGRLLTVNGNIAVTNTQSKFGGYCAYLNGTDYLTIPSSSDFAFGTGDFTIELWVYFTSLPSTAQLLDGRSGIVAAPWVLTVSGASPYSSWPANTFGWYNGAYNVTTGITPQLNTWYHVAVVRKSNVLNLFVNGVSYLSITDNSNIAANNILVGRGYDNLTYPNIYIDELRITKGKALYSQTMTRSLLHGEQSDSVVSVTSYPALSKAGNLESVNSISKFGDTSLAINNGYLYTGTKDWELYDFTISFWIYPKSWTGIHSLFASDRSGIGGMWLAADGANLYTWFQPTHNEAFVSWGAAPTINNWHYIMLTRIGSTTTLYVDGVSRGNPNFGTYPLKFNWAYGVSIGQAFYSGSTYGDPLVANFNDYVLKNVGSANVVPSGHPTYNSNTDLIFAKFDDPVGTVSSLGGLAVIDSVAGNTVTPYGGVSYSDSIVKVNAASLYIPLASRIVVSGSKLNLGTADFTVEYWMYLTAYTTGNGTHYNVQIDARAGGSGPLIALDANKKLFHTSGTVSTSIIALNTWYHVAWVRRNGTTTLYVNGVAEGSIVDTTSYTSTIWAIGNAYTGYDSWSLTGYLDEFHITDTAKYTSNFTPSVAANTASSITYSPSGAIVSFPPTAPFTYEGSSIGITNPIPPIAAFPSCRKTWTGTPDAYCGNVILLLNADGLATDTVFYDDSILAQPVTKNGTVAYNTTVHKFWDSSAYFNGAGSLQVPHSSDFDFGTSDFTIETWMYRTADTDCLIYDKRINATVADNIGISPRAGGVINLYCSSNGSGWDMFAVAVATGISINTWYHIALVRSGSTWMFFVNGALTWTGTSSAAVHANTYPVTIGSASGLGYPFTGYLSDYRVTKGVSRYGSNPTKLLMHFDTPFRSGYLDVKNNPSFYTTAIPPLVPGKFGECASFDGSTVYDPYWTIPSIGTVWTIEYWVKYKTPLPSYPTTVIISNGINAANGYQLMLQLRGNQAQFEAYVMGASGIQVLSPQPSVVLDGQFHHYAFVSDGTLLKVYIDGVFDSQSAVTINLTQPTLTLGHQNYNGPYFSNLDLDEVRISNIVRYTGNFAVATQQFVDDTNTIFLCHFDIIGSVAAVEATGKAVTAYGNTTVSSIQSKFGGYSAYFDGTGDYLEIPASSDFALGTDDFTIECWVYINSFPATTGIMLIDGRGAGSTNRPWQLCVAGAASVWWPANCFAYYTGTQYIATTGIIPAVATWYHVAVCRKSAVTSIFVNGVSYASASDTNNITGYGIRVGGSFDNGYFLDGYLDELRITKGKAIVPSLTGDTALLHCDSLPVIDTVGLATWTDGLNGVGGAGSVTINSSIKKFGAGSYNFPGGGYSYLYSSNVSIADFGTSDFTMECWIYLTMQTTNTGHTVVSTTPDANLKGFLWEVNRIASSGKAMFFANYGPETFFNSSAGYLSANAWHHIAVARQGTKFMMFIDGTLDTTFTISTATTFGTAGCSHIAVGTMMDYSAGYPFLGNMDEFRITKGLARYTASFTPAAQAYASVQSPSILDQDGNVFPPTQPYSYTGAVTALGGTIPPTDKLLKCGAGTV